MNEHAFLPLSGANEWVACAAWPTMNARYPETEPTPEAVEGTAAHWVALQLWSNVPVSVGDRAPNGHVVDDEMLDAAERLCEIVAGLDPDHSSVWERKVYGRRVHDSLNWGTPDIRRFARPVLDVIEYKYGHDYVPEYENFQLLNQAALILEELGVDGSNDEGVLVRMRVFQPRWFGRGGQHRVWEAQASHLRQYFNVLRNSAAIATRPEPPASTGPQCKHCPGRAACDTLQRVAAGLVDVSKGSSLPVDLTADQTGRELRHITAAIKRLEARRTGLEEQAQAMIRRGERVPYWALEQGQGREGWTAPISQITMAGALLGVDVAKPGVLTPAQARKAGMPAEVVAKLSERPAAALKLVPVDDSSARRAFGR